MPWVRPATSTAALSMQHACQIQKGCLSSVPPDTLCAILHLHAAGQDARIQLWCRHRPGDLLDDRYSTGISAAYGPGMLPHETGVSHGLGLADHKPAAARASVIPGVGAVKEQLGTQQGEQSTLDAKALAAAISVAQHISQQHATGPPGIGSSGRGDAHFHAGGMKRMRPSDDRFEGPSSSHMRGPPSQQHRRDFTPPPGAIGALAPPGPPAGPPPPMRGPKPPQPMHHPSGPGPMGHPPPGSGPMGPAPSRYPPPLGGVPHRGGPPPAGHPDYRERDRGPPPYGQHPDMGPPPYGRPGHPQHGGPPMHAGPPFNGPPPHGPPGPPGRPMGPPPGPPGQGQGPVPGQGQGRGARPPPPQRSFR